MPPTHLTLMLLLALAAHAHRSPYNTSSQRQLGAINVHLVMHTHNDVGWRLNVDTYFYGSAPQTQRASVRKILHAVVHALAWNPDRKFSYVESAFFERFWDELDERTAELVRGLVASGQLEFVNGAMSMHDEACTSYADMIDNTAAGHRLLKSNFGATPRATWSIDREWCTSRERFKLIASLLSGRRASM